VRSERGTALIEFALVLPILAAIIFGGIDFGFVFKDFISVRQSVGDVGRQASVGQFGTSTCTLTPAPANAQTKALMCAVHSQAGLDTSRMRVAVYVGDNQPGDKDKFTQGQPITICAEYKLQSVTGILKPVINGHVATSTATEMIALSGVSPTPVSASENPFTDSKGHLIAFPSSCTSGPPVG
jgi:Flp pilus assembly protein TadG